MKKDNLLVAFHIITVVVSLFTFWGCRKMDDTYREFLKEGETTYIAKADSIEVRGGRNRVELTWLLLSDPKIASYKVYWNNRRDSLESEVVKTTEVDTVRLLLTNMKEGNHEFEIYTFDKYGNTSVKSSKIGKVYGDRYASSLLSATYTELVRNRNGLDIVWAEPNEDLVAVDVIYQDINDEMKEIHVQMDADTTTLEGLPLGGEFKLKSFFLPDSNALDTFATDYAVTKLKVDTLVDWKNYRRIFGHASSLIMIGDGAVFNPNIYRILLNESTGFYQAPSRIGGSWNGLNNVSSRGQYFIAQLTGKGGLPRRYNYKHSTGTFPGPNPDIIGGDGWADVDKFFIFNDDIMVRDKNTGKLIRHYLNKDATEVIKSEDVLASESWSRYDKMIASQSWIFASTQDGKVWRISLSNDNKAGTPVQVSEGWDKYFEISAHGDNILARTPDGELWEYPVDEKGKLGSPKDIWVIKETRY